MFRSRATLLSVSALIKFSGNTRRLDSLRARSLLTATKTSSIPLSFLNVVAHHRLHSTKTTIELGLHFNLQVVYAALRTYKSLLVPQENSSSWTIPASFVVPHGNADWPKQTWGVALGAKVNEIIMNGNLYEKVWRFRLHALGLSVSQQFENYLPMEKKGGKFKDASMHFASMNERSDVFIIAAVNEYKERMVPKHMRDRFVIPLSFVVPQNTSNKTTPHLQGEDGNILDTPWPQRFHGLKLGQIVMDLSRAGGEKNGSQSLRVTDSDAGGTSTTGKAAGGGATDSGNIGASTSGINSSSSTRSITKASREYSEAKSIDKLCAALSEVGLFIGDYLDNRGQVILEALQVYKQLCVPSHMAKFTVPQSFVIPSGKTAVAEGWPEELWGLQLGKCVHYIRSMDRHASFHTSYEKLGLVMCSMIEHKGTVLAAALESFKKEVVLKDNSTKYLVRSAKDQAKIIVGERIDDNVLPPTIKFRVPQSFVVPINSPDWPPETWGMKLGVAVKSLRRGEAVYSDMDMERFASIGLYLPPEGVAKYTKRTKSATLKGVADDIVLAAVKEYKERMVPKHMGDCFLIPNRFVVPRKQLVSNSTGTGKAASALSPWPKDLRGLPLGRIVQDLFRGKDSMNAKIIATSSAETLPQRPPSEEDSVDNDGGNSLRVALSELGVTGANIRHHRALLIGRALQVYKQLCVPSQVAKFMVPKPFVVPSGTTAVAKGWPESLWGLRLGILTNDIRNKSHYASYCASYEKIGLDMSTEKEQAVAILVLALKTFKKEVVLKGNSAKYLVSSTNGSSISVLGDGGSKNALPPTIKFRVPRRFVVPMDSPDWPPETWGMKLGLTVSSLKSRRAVYSDMDMERFASIGLDVSPTKSASNLLNVESSAPLAAAGREVKGV
jgi:hypothetical protein